MSRSYFLPASAFFILGIAKAHDRLVPNLQTNVCSTFCEPEDVASGIEECEIRI